MSTNVMEITIVQPTQFVIIQLGVIIVRVKLDFLEMVWLALVSVLENGLQLSFRFF